MAYLNTNIVTIQNTAVTKMVPAFSIAIKIAVMDAHIAIQKKY